MNTFLIYILESTICISVFYLLFRLLMRKETSFAVNRATLLTIVAASVIVPLVQLPQLMHTPVHVELIPEFSENKIQIQNLPGSENATSYEVQPSFSESAPATNELTIPLETLLRYFYLSGVLVALLLFIRNVSLIFLLSRKATVRQMDGYRLLIVDREVPSFAFGRSVVISQTDYEAHSSAILAHEQAHIRQNHFVDLLLLELVRTIHWFNPAVYALIGTMKEIHEFQADEHTLSSGIDATQYQLLVIQKGVGPRRFALANSFNHCQIKKRITMMNRQKTSKAWRWKVATFLPLLALMLMAFGNRSEKVPPEQNLFRSEILTDRQDSLKQWTEADFKSIAGKEIEKLFFDGKKIVNVLMNSESQLMIGEIKCQMADVPDRIRRFRDFSSAKDKSLFSKISINGKERMVATIPIIVRKDIAANTDDYQKLLNTIGNTILELRGKYANEIFGKSYFKISEIQSNEIDKLIPFEVYLATPKSGNSKSQSGRLIEIRKDGNYIDNKLCTLEEIVNKGKEWGKASNDWIHLRIDESIPYNRIDEIRGKLRDAKVYHITQSTFNSDEIVYPAGDVSKSAKFSQGSWNSWINPQIKQLIGDKIVELEYSLMIGFITDKNGKVRDARLIKKSDYPEINAAYEKVLTKIPDWTPAMRGNENVSVFNEMMVMTRINKVKKIVK